MYTYVVNIRNTYQTEVMGDHGDKLVNAKTTNVPWYVTHEEKYTNSEFKNICQLAMSDVEKKWGMNNVLHPFVDTMKGKYGFREMDVLGNFTFETL